MSDAKCAGCNTVLGPRELDEGWCNSCGKSIPMFVYHESGRKGPKGKALSRSSAPTAPPPPSAMDPEEKIPTWQLAALGAFMLIIAAVIVGAFV